MQNARIFAKKLYGEENFAFLPGAVGIFALLYRYSLKTAQTNGIMNYLLEMRRSLINWDLIATYLARAIALLTAIPVHESAHAWVSWKLGDPTAKNAGRISLNPLHHFDLLGALCMLLVGFGWAKPVPIAATWNFRHPKRDMAVSAAAGPVSNLLLGFLCTIAYKFVYYLAPATTAWSFVGSVLYTMILCNISLAVFNLLPVPPLDGSRIFNIFLPQRAYFGIMRYEKYIMIALFVLLWTGVLDTPLGWLTNTVLRGLVASTGFVELLLGVG